MTESELNAARSEYERARLAYRATGGRRGGGTAVAAPLTGYVKACLVKEGDYVGVGQPLASVTRNSRLYLRADVPQRHYAALASVRSARFRPAYSDSVYDVSRLDGRLLSVGRASAAGSAPQTQPTNMQNSRAPAGIIRLSVNFSITAFMGSI